MSMQHRDWLKPVQVIVTATLLCLLVLSIDWVDTSRVFVHSNFKLLSLASLLVFLCHLLNIGRWRTILQCDSVPIRRLLTYYGVGLFANNFLPTGIGGDGVRTTLLSPDVSFRRALLSVTLDRGLGFAALPLFVVPGLWYGLPPGLMEQLTGGVAARMPVALWLVVIVISLAGLWLVLHRYLPSLRRVPQHYGLTQNDDSTGTSRGKWLHALGSGYALSIGSQLGLIIAHWLILQALHIDVSPGAAIWLVLLVSASMLVPISVNGLGLQESVYVVVLAAYGVTSPAALGVALVIRLYMVLFSLLGGLSLLVCKLPLRVRETPSI
jgi:glycosyltransferase 2 family protein